MTLAQFSMYMLYASFGFYSIGTILFGLSIRDKNKSEETETNKMATAAITVTIIGFLSQLTYFITRWIASGHARSEEHTSELQSRGHLVCRLLLEKKKKTKKNKF